jgi:hypothetical protein
MPGVIDAILLCVGHGQKGPPIVDVLDSSREACLITQ